jgi:hypothetical protein
MDIPGQSANDASQVLIALQNALDLPLSESDRQMVYEAIEGLQAAKVDPFSTGVTSAEAQEAMNYGAAVMAQIDQGSWVGSPPGDPSPLLDYQPQGGYDSGYGSSEASGYDSGYEADDEGEPDPGQYQQYDQTEGSGEPSGEDGDIFKLDQ